MKQVRYGRPTNIRCHGQKKKKKLCRLCHPVPRFVRPCAKWLGSTTASFLRNWDFSLLQNLFQNQVSVRVFTYSLSPLCASVSQAFFRKEIPEIIVHIHRNPCLLKRCGRGGGKEETVIRVRSLVQYFRLSPDKNSRDISRYIYILFCGI
jgi:hypothetical protein